ncbi:hypothetical protein [Halomarina oriensis]|uniref:ATP phosphoribosyltransferase n=1 Tax=Halomarina oriensis TaxID=671145 RepID=A0A6B0GLF5_9EURY|nr:hypothetical protein [Halomarina oriensis]MWG33613.1 hypothetical protein [Halomarina oriensis]
MADISVAVPRKGRPLEAVLERLATHTGTTDLADEVISTLRYEKAVTKGQQAADRSVYDRLAAYSEGNAEYTLCRDGREGFPRRIVFDSVTWRLDDHEVRLIGREEPFRALRKHEFALGFDSADLVLEEVVGLAPTPLRDIADVNDRIDPLDTDVRVVTGLGDTVYHTLLATPAVADGDLDRSFVEEYVGPVCISPRYERLVEAVVGTDALDGIEFCYPSEGVEEEAAIAEAGLGVYVTVTGSTARDHGLVLGEPLFPSETVLLENESESRPVDERLKQVLEPVETELAVR